jgi:hypothetical protein
MKAKRFEDLSERQRKACYAFSKAYGPPVEIIAEHLDWFFCYANGEIDARELEKQTGVCVFDYEQPTLF